ncbi:MAG: hypothetical protein KAJ69_04195 [Thermoplasmatales archaeon]|nr:hypothetical protein [Thermoplasmatales archaeon]
MKQKIIVVSILSVFILMVLPSIPAVEYDVAIKANESSLIDELQGIDVTDFKERIQKINIHELREELKNIDVRSAVEGLKGKIRDNPAQPQCIVTFIALILLLKLFGSIIGLIFAAVSAIVDAASIILGKIVTLTFAILKPIIKLTVLSLIAYFVIAGMIDLAFLCMFLLLIILTGGS